MGDSCALWLESPLITAASTKRTSAARCDDGAGSPFSFGFNSGGAVFKHQLLPPAQPARDPSAGIAWQVENGATATLQLLEFSLGTGPQGPALAIDFPTQLFPGVAIVPSPSAPEHAAVVGVTSNGQLFLLDLAAVAAQPQQPAADSLQFIDVSAHWASLGTPTCLAGAAGHVVIGGSNGPVLCIPAAWLQEATRLAAAAGAPAAAAARPFELRESSWGIKSLIAGVWQRGRNPAAVSVSILPSSTQDKAGLLLVTYDDATVRGFSLARRAQLFTEALESDAPARSSTPVFASAMPEGPYAGANAVLAVQLEQRDTLHKSACAYILSASSGGRMAVARRLDLQAPPGADMVSAAVAGSTLLALFKGAGGATQLVGFDLNGAGEVCGAGALAEASMLPQVGAGPVPGSDSMLEVGSLCVCVWAYVCACVCAAQKMLRMHAGRIFWVSVPSSLIHACLRYAMHMCQLQACAYNAISSVPVLAHPHSLCPCIALHFLQALWQASLTAGGSSSTPRASEAGAPSSGATAGDAGVCVCVCV